MTPPSDAQSAAFAFASAKETLRKLFQASPSYVLVSNWPDERIVSANPLFLQATGHAEDAVRGRTPDEIGLWADPEDYRRWRADFDLAGEVREREIWLRTRDGRPLFGSLTAVPIELAGGPGMLVMVRDITTQKDLSRKARESNEKYAAVFDNNPAACCISRGIDGVILEVNDAWVRFSMRPREAVIGRSAIELGMWASFGDRARLIERFDAEGGVRDHRIGFTRSDGTPIEALLSLARLRLGRRHCVVWTWTDITRSRQGERALAESEARFRSLTELSSDYFWEQDAQHRLSRIEGHNITGGNAEFVRGLIGKRVWESGIEIDGGWAALRALLDARQPIRDVVMRRVTSSGERRIVSILGEPVFDGNAKFAGYRGVGRDISEQQSAAEWMRLEHHVARTLADADSARSGIEAVCGAVCGATGWLCGRFFRAYPEADLLRMDAAWGVPDTAVQRFVEASQGLSMRRGEGLAGEVWRSGRALWLPDTSTDPRLLGKALARDFGPYGAVILPVTAQAKVIGVLSFASRELRKPDARLTDSLRSICDQVGQFLRRKHAEQALRESEERFRSLTALSSDYYWEQDESYRFVQRRGEGLQAPGFPVEDVTGRTRWELDCPGMTEEAWARHRADLEARRTFRDFVIARPGSDGQTHHYSISGEPIYHDDGSFRGYRGVGKEVTERIRAEARVRELNVNLEQRVRERTADLEAANRDLDSFSYSVSHDLKAPIGAINGFAYLLRNNESSRLSEDGARLLGLIERNAERTVGLVDGLLAFSQLGRKSVLGSPVPMGALLAEAIEELRVEQRWREVDLTIGPMPDCRGDALLLRQVWKNLVSNALKFSRQRDPAVIAIGYDQAAAAYFVRDNGAGFDMRHAQKLFSVFERLHGETEFEGTGIGLAIVQRIVQRHGGMISAEGEPGNGATFRFSLPG